MLTRLLGVTATSMVARQIGGVAAGPVGAVVGMALPFVARRLGPMGMVAMAVGGWAIARLLKEADERANVERANAETVNVTPTAPPIV